MKYIKCKYVLWEDDFVEQTVITGYFVKNRFYTLFEDGRLAFRFGFPWDGATFCPDYKKIIKPSMVHDAFCEMVNAGQLPPHVQALADEEFRLSEKDEKMHWFRRMFTYMFVRFYQINKKLGWKRKIHDTDS